MADVSLLGKDRNVEVPLMAIAEGRNGSDDEENDGVITVNGTKKGFWWSPFSAHRRRMFPTGGRREWRAETDGGQRACSCRPIICLPLTMMLFMALVLTVFLVYPIVKRHGMPRYRDMWLSDYCEDGLQLMTDMCACLDDITEEMQKYSGSITTRKTLITTLKITTCLYFCVNERPDEDMGLLFNATDIADDPKSEDFSESEDADSKDLDDN